MNHIIITDSEILEFFENNKDTNPEKIILDIIRIYSYLKNNSIEKKIDSLIPDINNFDISQKVKFFIDKKIDDIDFNSILLTKFPSYDIKYTGDKPQYGDYLIKRKDKTDILINSIECVNNLEKNYIEKFLRDIQARKSNGIFISQKSGICDKKDMEIEIFGNLIMVYIHNCNYDSSKIENSISLIDNINEIIGRFEDKGINISYKTIQNIIKEYNKFVKNKEDIIKNIKENSKKTIDDILGLKFSKLENFLIENYPDSIADKTFQCPECSSNFPTQNGINSHMKSHKKE